MPRTRPQGLIVAQTLSVFLNSEERELLLRAGVPLSTIASRGRWEQSKAHDLRPWPCHRSSSLRHQGDIGPQICLWARLTQNSMFCTNQVLMAVSTYAEGAGRRCQGAACTVAPSQVSQYPATGRTVNARGLLKQFIPLFNTRPSWLPRRRRSERAKARPPCSISATGRLLAGV